MIQFDLFIAGMRKPGAEDVRRAVRKSSSKRALKEVDERAPAVLPASERLCIGGAAPPVTKKPRTDRGASGPSERGVQAASGARGKAPSTGSVVDLTTPSEVRPTTAEANQGAPAKLPAVAGPSEPGPSRRISAAQLVRSVGRDFTEAESLGEVSAFGDSAAAASLFESILLPADVAELSCHSITEITDSVFPAMAWVSSPI